MTRSYTIILRMSQGVFGNRKIDRSEQVSIANYTYDLYMIQYQLKHY